MTSKPERSGLTASIVRVGENETCRGCRCLEEESGLEGEVGGGGTRTRRRARIMPATKGV